MTPSEQAKQAGLKNLAELSEITGRSRKTLDNWFKRCPRFFEVIVAGAVAVKKRNK